MEEFKTKKGNVVFCVKVSKGRLFVSEPIKVQSFGKKSIVIDFGAFTGTRLSVNINELARNQEKDSRLKIERIYCNKDEIEEAKFVLGRAFL